MNDGFTLAPADQSAGSSDEIRLSLRLSPKAKSELDWSAQELDGSMTETVRRAISVLKLFLETKNHGGRILIQERGQPMKEIIIT